MFHCGAQDAERAASAYDAAVALAPDDSRLLYERDRLARRRRVAPAQRLAALEAHMDLVRGRDALAVEACALYNQLGRPAAAAALLASRRFQPWEGGEGAALGQHVRAHLALGRAELAAGRAGEAAAEFRAALESPPNLGEAKHLLANDSDVRYWLGAALEAAGKQVGGWQPRADVACTAEMPRREAPVRVPPALSLLLPLRPLLLTPYGPSNLPLVLWCRRRRPRSGRRPPPSKATFKAWRCAPLVR